MRILIVDDEAPARDRLKRLLADIEGVELIGQAEDGVQAVEMIEQEQPDLVLLDIQMPGLDGFGVIKALEEPPPLVFVTAYDEYAIRAFEVNALDYLLKPTAANGWKGPSAAPGKRRPSNRTSLRGLPHCWRA